MQDISKKLKSFDYFPFIRILAAIAISVIIITIIIFSVSKEPLNALNSLFLGPLQSTRSFIDVFSYMIPLVFTGLAMNIVFKAGIFNMGADGSFYMGAVISAIIAVTVTLPNGLCQPIIILVASIVGGVINTIPALVKRYTGANAVVVSLMLNFAFFYLGLFLMNSTILDNVGDASFPFRKEALIPKIFPRYSIHWGILLMTVVVIIMYFIVERSKFGYQLKICGVNRKFAKYSGIKVGMVILISQFIGGVLAGMGGSVEMLGMFTRFTWVLQVMYVWDGLLVNILAAERPLMIPFAAFFLSYIRTGADIMSFNSDVDSTIISIIQGVIILLVSSERFLYIMKKRRDEKAALENNEEYEKMQAEISKGRV